MNEKQFLAGQRMVAEGALFGKLGDWSEELQPLADLERWTNHHPWLLLVSSFAAAFGGASIIFGRRRAPEQLLAVTDGRLKPPRKHRLARFAAARAIRLLRQLSQTALLAGIARTQLGEEVGEEAPPEFWGEPFNEFRESPGEQRAF